MHTHLVENMLWFERNITPPSGRQSAITPFFSLCCLPQTEQASKVATVSPGSGSTHVTEEAATTSSPALAKTPSQTLGPSAPGYDGLPLVTPGDGAI